MEKPHDKFFQVFRVFPFPDVVCRVAKEKRIFRIFAESRSRKNNLEKRRSRAVRFETSSFAQKVHFLTLSPVFLSTIG